MTDTPKTGDIVTICAICREKTIYNEFSYALMQRRKKLKLSIDDLAKDVGVCRLTMSNIENSKSAPSLDVAFKIAKRLGISLDHIRDLV